MNYLLNLQISKQHKSCLKTAKVLKIKRLSKKWYLTDTVFL